MWLSHYMCVDTGGGGGGGGGVAYSAVIDMQMSDSTSCSCLSHAFNSHTMGDKRILYPMYVHNPTCTKYVRTSNMKNCPLCAGVMQAPGSAASPSRLLKLGKEITSVLKQFCCKGVPLICKCNLYPYWVHTKSVTPCQKGWIISNVKSHHYCYNFS